METDLGDASEQAKEQHELHLAPHGWAQRLLRIRPAAPAPADRHAQQLGDGRRALEEVVHQGEDGEQQRALIRAYLAGYERAVSEAREALRID